MTYFDGAVYIVRLEQDGFFLEKAQVSVPGQNGEREAEIIAFYEYPNALRDLGYFHMNPGNKRLVVTTKSGYIKQYDFSGTLVFEHPAAESGSLPFSVITGNDNNLIYTDILSGEIVLVDTGTREARVLIEPQEGGPYYRLNCSGETFFAASYDNILTGSVSAGEEIINFYRYSRSSRYFRTALFAAAVFEILLFLLLFIFLISVLSKMKFTGSFKLILFSGTCIAFGAIVSALLIINEMNRLYIEKTYTDLENVSRLMAATVDTGVLSSLVSPRQYDSEEYMRLKNSLKELFRQSRFDGDRIYQMIWMERDGVVYSMCDLESSWGIFYPFDEYTDDSYYRQVYETGEYVHFSDVTSEGSWIFACGPIFDKEGNVSALLETGYDMRAIEEQTRTMIVQTILIVFVAIIAILFIIIEFILIFGAYKKVQAERITDESRLPNPELFRVFFLLLDTYKRVKNSRTGKSPVIFHPELPRALIFFLFVTCNLAAALLPMYAANLYQPLFNLPRELVVTLPFTADMIFAALALLVIPLVLEKAGLKRIGLLSAVLLFAANILCFVAPNVVYLAVAYALTGFSSGALILVINTVIGAQKDVKDVNSGFAHFNASYLAGVNVGVVLGSILAQFFPYRLVFLFSSFTALILLMVFIFSVRSKILTHIYNITYVKNAEGGRFSLIKFIFHPVVIASLVLLLLPYTVSLSFTSYFMPVFGIENGLRESNIGQLILLSGLFAILFGTSLCEYAATKLSLKTIVTASLLLNAAGIYLFSLNVSTAMLVVVVTILAIANIFALTNIQTYYATLYQDTPVSSMKALSVYSAVENISMAIGPVIFSYILAGNIGASMKIFALALAVCLIVFLVVSALFGKKNAAL
ncbi:MAG: MFS transporter [Treponema sp.]|jgi:predicted MFS family arabinose efflux permease|nr:MFS transporter [Treponema sp.]